MEHVVFDGAEVMVGDPQFLQKKMSAVRFEGPAKLQVLSFVFGPFNFTNCFWCGFVL